MMNADLPDCSRAMQIHHTSVDTSPTLTGSNNAEQKRQDKAQIWLKYAVSRATTNAGEGFASDFTLVGARPLSAQDLALAANRGQRTRYNRKLVISRS
jgi:hypothetical protein